jgi:hypothetical protein
MLVFVTILTLTVGMILSTTIPQQEVSAQNMTDGDNKTDVGNMTDTTNATASISRMAPPDRPTDR